MLWGNRKTNLEFLVVIQRRERSSDFYFLVDRYITISLFMIVIM